ncbi:MAG: glycerol-3-phosphate dehydrogenase C-terminal domain-containing protein, partial [Bryobacteraceae bacterium]
PAAAPFPLGGNTRQRLDEMRRRLAGPEANLLVSLYGIEAERVLSYLPSDGPSALPPLRAARIAYACRHEMARRLTDVLTASTYWGYEQRWTADNLRPYASAMAGHLGWDQARVSAEIESALRRFQSNVGCG